MDISFQLFKDLWGLIDPGERARVVAIFIMMLVASVFEVLGASSIMPFMALLSNPEAVDHSRFVSLIRDLSGIDDSESLLVVLGFISFGVVFTSIVINATLNFVTTRFSFQQNHALSMQLMSSYLRRPYLFF